MLRRLGNDHFWIKVARGAGALSQRLVYTEEELLISLSNSLKMREQEVASRNGLAGRFLAFFVGRDDGRAIPVDGMRLKQLHDLAEARPKQEIDLNATYNVNLAHFRVLLGRAHKAVESRP